VGQPFSLHLISLTFLQRLTCPVPPRGALTLLEDPSRYPMTFRYLGSLWTFRLEMNLYFAGIWRMLAGRDCPCLVSGILLPVSGEKRDRESEVEKRKP